MLIGIQYKQHDNREKQKSEVTDHLAMLKSCCMYIFTM